MDQICTYGQKTHFLWEKNTSLLNNLKRINHYYDNFTALEYKENKQEIWKELESLDDTIKYIDGHNIQFGNLILWNWIFQHSNKNLKKENYKKYLFNIKSILKFLMFQKLWKI